MKEKGFTLIELLAVIVILAIIAIIATPIIINIINDTKEQTTLTSAKFYLDAVENSMAKTLLHENEIKDGTYKIMEDGNLCLGILNDNSCNGYILKVDVDGELPSVGSTIKIIKGQISEVNLEYNGKNIIKDGNGNLIYDKSKNKYKLGQEIVFNPGDEERTWNVIGEDYDTVTLMLNQNIGEIISWHADAEDNSYGPVTALNYLNTLTINWKNVEPISSYSFINNETGSKIVESAGESGTIPVYGYKKLEISNGQAKLINIDGTKTTNIGGVTRARLITAQEIIKISKELNPNLNEENLRNIFSENIEQIAKMIKLDYIQDIELLELYLSMYTHNGTNEENLIWLAITLNFLEYDFAEGLDMPQFLYQNMFDYIGDEIASYWVLNSVNLNSIEGEETVDSAYIVGTFGSLSDRDVFSYSRLRPVITVSKAKL